jgi:Holliday junction resolvase RusA-like endonuclease
MYDMQICDWCGNYALCDQSDPDSDSWICDCCCEAAADMPEAIRLWVPAVPVAQPRVKATSIQGRASVYTPQTIGSGPNRRPHPIHAFKATVRLVAAREYQGPPIDSPVAVDVLLIFPRERSKVWKHKPMLRYPHTVKPDRDNCDKAILDSLKGIILADDCIVYHGRITKLRAAGNEQPHCEITITVDLNKY